MKKITWKQNILWDRLSFEKMGWYPNRYEESVEDLNFGKLAWFCYWVVMRLKTGLFHLLQKISWNKFLSFLKKCQRFFSDFKELLFCLKKIWNIFHNGFIKKFFEPKFFVVVVKLNVEKDLFWHSLKSSKEIEIQKTRKKCFLKMNNYLW